MFSFYMYVVLHRHNCTIPSGFCLGGDANILSKIPGVKAFVDGV